MTAIYSRDDASAALNKAADDILDCIGREDGRTDLANLFVNVGLHYLDHPSADLTDAIEAQYDGEDPAEVLGWIDS